MTTTVKYIVEGTGAATIDAVEIPIADAGSLFTGTNVETVTQEIGTTVAGLVLRPILSVTTKGDIQTFNATVPAKLAVGTDGQVLTANSGEVTGLKWISGLTQDVVVLTALPSTFATLHFTNGILTSVS